LKQNNIPIKSDKTTKRADISLIHESA